jgi:hypothetical protein
MPKSQEETQAEAAYSAAMAHHMQMMQQTKDPNTLSASQRGVDAAGARLSAVRMANPAAGPTAPAAPAKSSAPTILGFPLY